jgi:hypothetical protein
MIYVDFLLGLPVSASLCGASGGARTAPVTQKTEVMDR